MHVAWSKDGRYLAASDLSTDHCVAIFDMQAKVKSGAKMTPIASGKGSRNTILSLGFNATGDALIATCVK
jgi:echinoderm microtubule-associated protein-like 6